MAQTFARVSQQAARYKLMGGVERCGRCRFFLRNNLCARVIGDVSPSAWCKFFSMAATMRTDAGGGAAATHAGSGGPPGVALDLSFMTPGTLDPRITFTRASIGTYYDVVGTLQTATANTPRWDYDPVTHALRGLLIEEQRINSMLQSGDFTNVAWSKSNSTLAAGTPGPNGATTGSGVISNNGVIGFVSQAFTPVAATAYTASCFLRAGSLSSVLLLMPAPWWADATNRTATFNLASGTVTGTAGTGATGTIAPVGNGWYRVSLTATPDTAAAGSMQFTRASANGDGVTIQHYAFGAQLEVGAFATSYIPTTAAAVTRPQDVATMPGPFINQAAGSMVAEHMITGRTSLPAGVFTYSLEIDDGTTSNLYTLRHITPTGNNGVCFAAGSNAGSPIVGLWVPDIVMKHGLTYVVATTITTCFNGGSIGSGALVATPATLNRVFLGGGRGTGALCGYLRRVQYWPRALSNSELQQVTT